MAKMVGQKTAAKVSNKVSNKDKYFNLIEHAADGIAIVQDGILKLVNSAFTRMSGYDSNELIGMPFINLLAPESRSFVMARYQDRLAGKEVPPIYETKAVTKVGKVLDIEVNAALTEHEGRVADEVIVRDTTERKQAEQALADEATRRRILVEQSRDGIVILDQTGKVFEANHRFSQMLGYSPKETLKLHVWDWDTQWTKEQLLEMLASVDAAGDHFETYHRRKDGTTYDVEISTNGAIIAGQKLVFCVCRDITERKQAEELFRTLADSAPVGIYIVQDRKFQYANPRFQELTGYSEDELLSMDSMSMVLPEDSNIVRENAVKMLKGVRSSPYEFRVINKAGETKWVIESVTSIQYHGKRANLGTYMDITEHKQAEEELQESERRFRDIAENALEWIWEVNVNGKYTYASPVCEKVLGYKPEELLGKYFYDLFLPEEREQLKEAAFETFTKKQTFCEFINQNIHKNGEIVWLSTSGVPKLDERGNLLGYRGMDTNVTERKQMEEKLRESEEKYRAIFEQALESIVLLDIETQALVDFNDKAYQNLGYSRKEFARLKISDVDAIQSQEEAEKHRATMYAEGTSVFETKQRTKEGNIRDVLVNGRIIKIGDKPYALCIWQDITERKQAEAELKLRAQILDGATDVIFLHDFEGNFVYVNESACRAHGYSREELMNMNLSQVLTPERATRIESDFQDMLEKGQVIFESSHLRKDGSVFPAEVHGRVIEAGGRKLLLAVVRDITERRQHEEELKLRAQILDSATDAIFLNDLDGNFIYANEAACRVHGYSREEFMKMNLLQLLTPEEASTFGSRFQKMQEKGMLFIESSHLRKDGSIMPVEVHGRAIEADGGKLLLAVVRDITERRQHEEELKLRAQILDSATDAIFVADVDKDFTYVNQAACRAYGYSQEELLNMNTRQLDAQEPAINLDAILHEMIEKGHVMFETLHRHKDGTTTPVEIHGHLFESGDRKLAISVVRDITKRKQGEAREQQLQQELNLASRLASIGEMASGIAHEINNPLTSVIGFSQLLMSQDIPEDISRDLKIINREAQRVAKIVSGLLAFAHKREPGHDYVAINDIISEALKLRSYEMTVNNIEVTTQLAPDLPHTMAASNELQQVFLNIIINAEKEMIRAHGGGKLLVKTQKKGNTIRVSFTDDGPGISKENLDKIFDPFFTTREVGDGTGLGLSICHGIITTHNGKIYAESKLGKGATFTIELPIWSDTIFMESGEFVGVKPHKEGEAKILVVDDETSILHFLKRLLTDEGYVVETVDRAQDALDRLNSQKYDIILMDIKMPVMNGIELYRKIEATDPTLTHRVIFITGDVMETTTRDFLDNTGVTHIPKPIDIEWLNKEINRILALS